VKYFSLPLFVVGIQDRRIDIGIFGGDLGVDDAAERIDDIVGRNRIAVRPFGVVAQMEGVDLAVVAHVPALGDAAGGIAVIVEGGEALIEVIRDIGLGHARQLLGIECFRLRPIAAIDDGICPCCRPGEQQARQGERGQFQPRRFECHDQSPVDSLTP
jgi:hypothetical protein